MNKSNMKRFSVISLILFLSTITLLAQNDPKAKAILDKTAIKFKQNAVKFDFTLTLEDTKTDKKKLVKGNALVKGEKFKLIVPSVDTYFDGKTEYVYVHRNNEVSISTPTKAELQDINPAYLLSSYTHKSSVQFSLDNKPETGIYTIDVFPDHSLKKNYYKAIVRIDRKSMQVLSIRVLCQNGVHTLFQISNLQGNQKFSDSYFVFDFKANPKVSVNDLR